MGRSKLRGMTSDDIWKRWVEHRTKRLILEIYDEMSVAARTGHPYATRLDPPPADPRVAHPDTRGERQ